MIFERRRNCLIFQRQTGLNQNRVFWLERAAQYCRYPFYPLGLLLLGGLGFASVMTAHSVVTFIHILGA